MGKILSWGKCDIIVEPIIGTGAATEEVYMFETPVEDSTNLSTTQGDKNEARVEGGGVDAVRYNANSYELTFDVRMHSGFKKNPLGGTDGVIPGEFTMYVKPENSAAPGVKINRSSANVQINFTADNGVIATYTFSSLVNVGGQQIEVGDFEYPSQDSE